MVVFLKSSRASLLFSCVLLYIFLQCSHCDRSEIMDNLNQKTLIFDACAEIQSRELEPIEMAEMWKMAVSEKIDRKLTPPQGLTPVIYKSSSNDIIRLGRSNLHISDPLPDTIGSEIYHLPIPINMQARKPPYVMRFKKFNFKKSDSLLQSDLGQKRVVTKYFPLLMSTYIRQQTSNTEESVPDIYKKFAHKHDNDDKKIYDEIANAGILDTIKRQVYYYYVAEKQQHKEKDENFVRPKQFRKQDDDYKKALHTFIASNQSQQQNHDYKQKNKENEINFVTLAQSKQQDDNYKQDNKENDMNFVTPKQFSQQYDDYKQEYKERHNVYVIKKEFIKEKDENSLRPKQFRKQDNDYKKENNIHFVTAKQFKQKDNGHKQINQENVRNFITLSQSEQQDNDHKQDIKENDENFVTPKQFIQQDDDDKQKNKENYANFVTPKHSIQQDDGYNQKNKEGDVNSVTPKQFIQQGDEYKHKNKVNDAIFATSKQFSQQYNDYEQEFKEYDIKFPMPKQFTQQDDDYKQDSKEKYVNFVRPNQFRKQDDDYKFEDITDKKSHNYTHNEASTQVAQAKKQEIYYYVVNQHYKAAKNSNNVNMEFVKPGQFEDITDKKSHNYTHNEESTQVAQAKKQEIYYYVVNQHYKAAKNSNNVNIEFVKPGQLRKEEKQNILGTRHNDKGNDPHQHTTLPKWVPKTQSRKTENYKDKKLPEVHENLEYLIKLRDDSLKNIGENTTTQKNTTPTQPSTKAEYTEFNHPHDNRSEKSKKLTTKAGFGTTALTTPKICYNFVPQQDEEDTLILPYLKRPWMDYNEDEYYVANEI